MLYFLHFIRPSMLSAFCAYLRLQISHNRIEMLRTCQLQAL